MIYSGHLLKLVVKLTPRTIYVASQDTLLFSANMRTTRTEILLDQPCPFVQTFLLPAHISPRFLISFYSSFYLQMTHNSFVCYAGVSYVFFNSFPLLLPGVFLFLAFIIHMFLPKSWTWTRRIYARPPHTEKSILCERSL